MTPAAAGAPRRGRPILAGIDGGGTRTRLALATAEGELLALAEGGCASCVEIGSEAARSVLAELWHAAWVRAGLAPRPVDGLFMGTGSVLSEEDALVNRGILLALGLAAQDALRVDNDAWNAHAGGLLGRPGILLIAGTGSACLGRNERGDTWRAGGWGHFLDDRGSAYSLGSAAMVAATRDTDGRGPRTALTGLVRGRLGLADLRGIYRRVHHEGLSRAEVAALAPDVVRAAEDGDAVAAAILQQGAAGLVEMVVTVAGRLALERPDIALTGGLIESTGQFRRLFLAGLERELPLSRLARGGLAPVLGAVLLARELARAGAPDGAFLERLRQGAARLGLCA